MGDVEAENQDFLPSFSDKLSRIGNKIGSAVISATFLTFLITCMLNREVTKAIGFRQMTILFS